MTLIEEFRKLLSTEWNMVLQNQNTVVLNDEYFDGNITDGNIWLVEFHAPWCGYCKKLNPLLEQAATELLEYPNLRISTLDGTKNPYTSIKYSVRAYPTLLFFKHGHYGKYQGPRTKDGFINFLKKLSEDEYITVKNEKALKYTLDKVHHSFILTLPQYKLYDKDFEYTQTQLDKIRMKWLHYYEDIVRRKHAHNHFIVYTPKASTAIRPPLSPSTENNRFTSHFLYPIYFGKYEQYRSPSMYPYNLSLTESIPKKRDFELFIDRYNHPFLSELDNHNFNILGNLNHTLCMLIYDPKMTSYQSISMNNTEMIHIFNQTVTNIHESTDPSVTHHMLSYSHPEHIVYTDINKPCIYGYIDGTKWRQFFRQYDVRTYPSLLLLDLHTDQYYYQALNKISLHECTDINTCISNKISSTINDYLGGKITLKQNKPKSIMDKIMSKFELYSPYSYFFLFLPVAFMIKAFFFTKYPEDKTKDKKNN